jgi:heat shock protein HtpX
MTIAEASIMTLTQQEGEFHFSIATETTPGYLRYLPEFLENYYVHRAFRRVEHVRRFNIENRHYLIFSAYLPKSSEHIDVTIEASTERGHPIQVIMARSSPEISEELLKGIQDDILLNIQLFEDYARQYTLYLAYIPGQKISEQKYGRGILEKLFTDSMVNLFIIFIVVAVGTFALFNAVFGQELSLLLSPIVIVVSQLLIVAYSGRLIARTSDWRITKDRPEVIVLQYTLTAQEADILRKKHRKKLPKIRKELYDSTLALGSQITCEKAHPVFEKYGIQCTPQNLIVKTVNLYDLVSKACGKFNVSIPTIVVSNKMAANAAATGLSPKRGTMLITTGAIVQLDENELFQVIGHEVSHLKGHDPFILFFILSIEYVVRVYALTFFPAIAAIITQLFIIYFILLLGGTFFVGKFFEAKSDLEAAKYLKEPKVMANSLRKIGFRRLIRKGGISWAFLDWIRLDPHPPLSWRIKRLDEIEDTSQIKHTFLKSIGDVFKGFISSIA